jgi:hypothetical protein
MTSVFVGRQVESEDDGEGERVLRAAMQALRPRPKSPTPSQTLSAGPSASSLLSVS